MLQIKRNLQHQTQTQTKNNKCENKKLFDQFFALIKSFHMVHMIEVVRQGKVVDFPHMIVSVAILVNIIISSINQRFYFFFIFKCMLTERNTNS